MDLLLLDPQNDAIVSPSHVGHETTFTKQAAHLLSSNSHWQLKALSANVCANKGCLWSEVGVC